jgi:hypothetical protein
VLELLTVSTDYDVVIKRALFVWSNEEVEMHRHVLETLRRRRNETVHAGRESKANLAPIFQLKRYVEELLLFHLRNRFGFTSIAKAALLDLPTHNAQLRDDFTFIRTLSSYCATRSTTTTSNHRFSSGVTSLSYKLEFEVNACRLGGGGAVEWCHDRRGKEARQRDR